jgi:adenylate cyclase
LADHAGLACEAALAMQEALKVLQRSWQARGLPQLHARLGLHTGLVIAGNVGSKERFNYTVMGDAVNLASRLEGVNKIYGTEILISEDTYEHLPTTIFSRELDIVQVKGRLQPVKIYELIANHRDGDVKSWQDSFQAGRFAYATGQWELAISNFKETLALRPGDRPAELFLDRCRHYRRHPPPPGWEGVFVLESK